MSSIALFSNSIYSYCCVSLQIFRVELFHFLSCHLVQNLAVIWQKHTHTQTHTVMIHFHWLYFAFNVLSLFSFFCYEWFHLWAAVSEWALLSVFASNTLCRKYKKVCCAFCNWFRFSSKSVAKLNQRWWWAWFLNGSIKAVWNLVVTWAVIVQADWMATCNIQAALFTSSPAYIAIMFTFITIKLTRMDLTFALLKYQICTVIGKNNRSTLLKKKNRLAGKVFYHTLFCLLTGRTV